MGTFLQIRQQVETNLIDLPTAVQSAIPRLVNSAMTFIQDQHNFKVMETLDQSFVTTGNNHGIGNMPSNFKEWRGLPYYLTFAADRKQIQIAPSREAALSVYNDDDIGAPTLLVDGEPNDQGVRELRVYPRPDQASDYSDGAYRIHLPYYRYVTALSLDGDTNWFTVNAEDWLVFRATAEGFAIDWDVENQAVWEAKAQSRLQAVLNKDKRYRLSGLTTLVPHYQGANTPQLQW